MLRRQILGALAATVAAPKQIASAVVETGVGDLSAPVNIENREPTCVGRTSDQGLWDLVYSKRNRHRRPLRDMPAHIDTMRSWSPAFKQHVWDSEERAFESLFDLIGKDESRARKALRLLGWLG
ncbi:MAG: hypothetical protein AAGF55_01095 [Pseudomonadota bacterium]